MTEHVFASSDPGRHTPNPETISGHRLLAPVRPQTAHKAVSSFQGGTMSRILDDPRGRPSRADSLHRQSRFLCLIAAGVNAEDAARQAKLSPWKALRIVTEADYLDVVRAIRDGAGPVTAVVASPNEELAA